MRAGEMADKLNGLSNLIACMESSQMIRDNVPTAIVLI
jgi:hypothetical protein